MNITKIALDPNRCEIPGDQKLTSAMADIRHGMVIHLTGALQKADLVRTMKLLGKPDLMIRAADNNEIKARFLIKMIDEFETLIAKGYGFTAALWMLIESHWYMQLSNFDSVE